MDLLRKMCLMLMAIVLIVAGTRAWSEGMDEAIPTPRPGVPNIEDYATIEGYTKGAPIYSFGNIASIYGVSPDLLPLSEMQAGNTNVKTRIKPKKSWEIKDNLCGAEHEMTVRSPWTDSQPFLPIHLIDGDPDTVWCSWGCNGPDARPEWIRIDLPMETTVASVALIASKKFPYPNYGRALPKELEIKLSRDAWHWDSVYQTKNLAGNETGATEIKFTPRPAKQIWILANNFLKQVPWAGYVFSIGGVEVRDTRGNNLALISRGAGVTVSSTSYGLLNDHITQDLLWGPLQYDLGNKWVRVGPDNGSFTWNYVELKKGVLQIDRRADESISECVRNGIKVIMNLDFKEGNWRYKNPPTRSDWRQDRFRKINDNYTDGPGPANQNPEMWAGWLRFVDYMVRHFKGRVTYWELGNEWNGAISPEQYMAVFEPTYAAVKNADPQAKIMLGSVVGFEPGKMLACLGQTGVSGKGNPIKPGLGPRLDAIGWHPLVSPDAAYVAAVKDFKSKAETLGFHGVYQATEIYSASLYPPGPPQYVSEMQYAKQIARLLICHNGLGMMAAPCHPHLTGFPCWSNHVRLTWPTQTLIPCQGAASYYVWRTMATIMECFRARDFPVSFAGQPNLMKFTFAGGDGRQLLIAAWNPAVLVDGISEVQCDLRMQGVAANQATAIDIFNGTEQKLNMTVVGGATVIPDLLIKDYPVLIRIVK